MGKLVKIDDKQIRIGLNNVAEIPDDFDTRILVANLSNFLAARMKSRTLLGLDRNMAAFAAYSPSYEKFKSSRGRGTNVNLTFGGTMLASLLPTIVSDTEAKVSMASAPEGRKALIHQLGLGVPKREFFGTTRADTVAAAGVDKITEREIDATIKRFKNKRG